MNHTPWATMKTLPPGSGSGPDLRAFMEYDRGVEADARARMAPGSFPCDPSRRWDVEALQEAVDGFNYASGGMLTGDVSDLPEWLYLQSAFRRAYRLAAELCRRRDEREGR